MTGDQLWCHVPARNWIIRIFAWKVPSVKQYSGLGEALRLRYASMQADDVMQLKMNLQEAQSIQ